MDQKQLIQIELTMSAGTVCKRTAFILTLNFPSAENDKNLFIESFTLRDALRFRICIEKYNFIQVKFLSTNLFLCFVRLSGTRKKTVNSILAFGHIL